MKKTTALCLAFSLALGSAGSAQADWGRHQGYRGPSQGHHQNHHYQGHGHRQGPNWAGPAAILAITGLAIGAAAYSQANSAPVYVAPPRQIQAAPDAGNWYYCGSSGQYYPYVRGCPEGWQTVMPPRQ